MLVRKKHYIIRSMRYSGYFTLAFSLRFTLACQYPIGMAIEEKKMVGTEFIHEGETYVITYKEGDYFRATPLSDPTGLTSVQFDLSDLGTGWKHCSPELLKGGINCGATLRRKCQCSFEGSHDHWI